MYRPRLFVIIASIFVITGATSRIANTQPAPQEQDIILDNIPGGVIASMEVRDRWFTSTAGPSEPESYLVDDLLRWLPGQTLRVAFLGGSAALHKDIEDAVR